MSGSAPCSCRSHVVEAVKLWETTQKKQHFLPLVLSSLDFVGSRHQCGGRTKQTLHQMLIFILLRVAPNAAPGRARFLDMSGTHIITGRGCGARQADRQKHLGPGQCLSFSPRYRRQPLVNFEGCDSRDVGQRAPILETLHTGAHCAAIPNDPVSISV